MNEKSNLQLLSNTTKLFAITGAVTWLQSARVGVAIDQRCLESEGVFVNRALYMFRQTYYSNIEALLGVK
jgi:hypothetical protein